MTVDGGGGDHLRTDAVGLGCVGAQQTLFVGLFAGARRRRRLLEPGVEVVAADAAELLLGDRAELDDHRRAVAGRQGGGREALGVLGGDLGGVERQGRFGLERRPFLIGRSRARRGRVDRLVGLFPVGQHRADPDHHEQSGGGRHDGDEALVPRGGGPTDGTRSPLRHG